jgi:hypothetical protein
VVEAAERLVENQQFGSIDERANDLRAALHAS